MKIQGKKIKLQKNYIKTGEKGLISASFQGNKLNIFRGLGFRLPLPSGGALIKKNVILILNYQIFQTKNPDGECAFFSRVCSGSEGSEPALCMRNKDCGSTKLLFTFYYLFDLRLPGVGVGAMRKCHGQDLQLVIIGGRVLKFCIIYKKFLKLSP